jgi:leader peptidase (prepilin peptidase)/N-methyltransferase
MLLLYAYIFLVGSVLGSFYNVVGLRVPVGQSIVKPRSACPTCEHALTPLELIPVFSYLFQKGKCRECGTKISSIYPAFELLTGVLFVLSPVILGWTNELFIAWTLVSLLIIIVVSDLSYMLIPNKILLFFSGVFLVERIFTPLEPWWNSLAGVAVGFGLLYAIAVLSKGGMGGGDVKLFALLGFVLGWKLVLVAFLLSSFFGSVFGVIGLFTGQVKKGKPMPFGPFIMLGTLCAYYFGDELLDYYFSFFYTW